MFTWTREDLERAYPVGSVTIEVDGVIRPMTFGEYSEWIRQQVGKRKTDSFEGAQRIRRNDLLAWSDYRVVGDAPWDTASWSAYRQALRDLPSDPNWPNVDFPVPPL